MSVHTETKWNKKEHQVKLYNTEILYIFLFFISNNKVTTKRDFGTELTVILQQNPFWAFKDLTISLKQERSTPKCGIRKNSKTRKEKKGKISAVTCINETQFLAIAVSPMTRPVARSNYIPHRFW